MGLCLKKVAQKGKKHRILKIGDPRLYEKSARIDPESQDVLDIMAHMAATLSCLKPVSGLAAPQIGFAVRIIFYQVMAHRADQYTKGGLPPVFLINPSYGPAGPEKELGPEACLSIPGLIGQVNRYKSICAQAILWDGEGFLPFSKTAHGFEARLLQHEIDHLDGILYPQRFP